MHDALCGLYSITNAISNIYRLSSDDREKLFKHLIKRLDKDKYVTHAVIDGTYKEHINDLLKAATAYMEKKHAVRIIAKPIFKRKAGVGLSKYWQTLTTFLEASKKRAVIIGMHGRYDHWTTVQSMEELSMKLLDSCGVRHLRRQSCRIGRPYTAKFYHLIPSQVWGLRLKD